MGWSSKGHKILNTRVIPVRIIFRRRAILHILKTFPISSAWKMKTYCICWHQNLNALIPFLSLHAVIGRFGKYMIMIGWETWREFKTCQSKILMSVLAHSKTNTHVASSQHLTRLTCLLSKNQGWDARHRLLRLESVFQTVLAAIIYKGIIKSLFIVFLILNPQNSFFDQK